LIDVSSSIHGLTREDLSAYCVNVGLPPFRAKQVWHWLYCRYVRDWASMKNIPESVRKRFASGLHMDAVTSERTDGATRETRKALVRLRDGEHVEQVLIPSASGRRTVCVSCQVGCRFACSFCASGQGGFRRNLGPGEMVGQVVQAARLFEDRPTRVVFMGMGEPFDNYDAVIRSARIINDPDGLNVGARRITISTAGVIPGIDRLATEGKQFELSVSLHAASDALRSQLMPINSRYPLKELIQACRNYTDRTKRIITFEYVLIRGRNDTRSHASDLAGLLRPLHCRVNLLPLSAVDESALRASSPETANLFIDILQRAGINATLRNSRGASIKAACGQLRFPSSDSPAFKQT